MKMSLSTEIFCHPKEIKAEFPELTGTCSTSPPTNPPHIFHHTYSTALDSAQKDFFLAEKHVIK